MHPLDGADHEVGVWLRRSSRGQGIGEAVLREVLACVRRAGGSALIADTTTDNAPALAVLRLLGAELVTVPGDVGTVGSRIEVK